MQARRISSTSSPTSRKRARSQDRLKAHRFLGLHLAGGKGDRTCLVVLDYFTNQNKLFLTHVFEHIQQEGDKSSDQELFETITGNINGGIESLSIDVPLKLPKCVTCQLKCPGYERCREKEVVWFWKQYRKQKRKRPRTKLFTPYTQRVVENYLATEVAEELAPLEAMGANSAPLLARAKFLLRRLKEFKVLEVYPSLSILRLGQVFKVAKSHLLHYKHQIGGDESRQVILDHLLENNIIFIYQQDYHRLIHNCDAFEAFFCAVTGFLKYKGMCEAAPKDLPLGQGWIEFPGRNVKDSLER